jgi:SAM-dependent methyltransferase
MLALKDGYPVYQLSQGPIAIDCPYGLVLIFKTQQVNLGGQPHFIYHAGNLPRLDIDKYEFGIERIHDASGIPENWWVAGKVNVRAFKVGPGASRGIRFYLSATLVSLFSKIKKSLLPWQMLVWVAPIVAAALFDGWRYELMPQALMLLIVFLVPVLLFGKLLMPGRSWSIKKDFTAYSKIKGMTGVGLLITFLGFLGWIFPTGQLVFTVILIFVSNFISDLGSQYTANQKIDLSQSLCKAIFMGLLNGFTIFHFYIWLDPHGWLFRWALAGAYATSLSCLVYRLLLLFIHRLHLTDQDSELKEEYSIAEIRAKAKGINGRLAGLEFFKHSIVQCPSLHLGPFNRILCTVVWGAINAIYYGHHVNKQNKISGDKLSAAPGASQEVARSDKKFTEKVAAIDEYYKVRETDGRLTAFRETEGGILASSSTDKLVAVADSLLSDGEDKKVLDAGSGTGKAVAVFSLYTKYAKGVEIDRGLLTQSLSSIADLDGKNVVDKKRIELIQADFWREEDFSRYDLIYLYWSYSVRESRRMAGRLQQKILRELKPDALLVINCSTAAKLKGFDALQRLDSPAEGIWVYRLKQQQIFEEKDQNGMLGNFKKKHINWVAGEVMAKRIELTPIESFNKYIGRIFHNRARCYFADFANHSPPFDDFPEVGAFLAYIDYEYKIIFTKPAYDLIQDNFPDDPQVVLNLKSAMKVIQKHEEVELSAQSHDIAMHAIEYYYPEATAKLMAALGLDMRGSSVLLNQAATTSANETMQRIARLYQLYRGLSTAGEIHTRRLRALSSTAAELGDILPLGDYVPAQFARIIALFPAGAWESYVSAPRCLYKNPYLLDNITLSVNDGKRQGALVIDFIFVLQEWKVSLRLMHHQQRRELHEQELEVLAKHAQDYRAFMEVVEELGEGRSFFELFSLDCIPGGDSAFTREKVVKRLGRESFVPQTERYLAGFSGSSLPPGPVAHDCRNNLLAQILSSVLGVGQNVAAQINAVAQAKEVRLQKQISKCEELLNDLDSFTQKYLSVNDIRPKDQYKTITCLAIAELFLRCLISGIDTGYLKCRPEREVYDPALKLLDDRAAALQERLDGVRQRLMLFSGIDLEELEEQVRARKKQIFLMPPGYQGYLFFADDDIVRLPDSWRVALDAARKYMRGEEMSVKSEAAKTQEVVTPADFQGVIATFADLEKELEGPPSFMALQIKSGISAASTLSEIIMQVNIQRLRQGKPLLLTQEKACTSTEQLEAAERDRLSPNDAAYEMLRGAIFEVIGRIKQLLDSEDLGRGKEISLKDIRDVLEALQSALDRFLEEGSLFKTALPMATPSGPAFMYCNGEKFYAAETFIDPKGADSPHVMVTHKSKIPDKQLGYKIEALAESRVEEMIILTLLDCFYLDPEVLSAIQVRLFGKVCYYRQPAQRYKRDAEIAGVSDWRVVIPEEDEADLEDHPGDKKRVNKIKKKDAGKLSGIANGSAQRLPQSGPISGRIEELFVHQRYVDTAMEEPGQRFSHRGPAPFEGMGWAHLDGPEQGSIDTEGFARRQEVRKFIAEGHIGFLELLKRIQERGYKTSELTLYQDIMACDFIN